MIPRQEKINKQLKNTFKNNIVRGNYVSNKMHNYSGNRSKEYIYIILQFKLSKINYTCLETCVMRKSL